MAKKATKKVEVKTFKTTDALRKGFRAYVGMYSAAYERIQPVFTKAAANYDEYATKGEALETVAQTYAKDARVRAEKSYSAVVSKVRSVLPTSANDHVVELEAEIADLNKKIVRLSKKSAKKTVTRAKKTAAKTTETVKTVVADVTATAEKVAEAIKAA